MIGRIRSALGRLFAGNRHPAPASSDPEANLPLQMSPRQRLRSEGASGADDVDGIPAFLRRRPSEATAGGPMLSQSDRFTTFLQAMEFDLSARARFAAAPEAVLADLGIDPAPYDLHPAMSDPEIDQLLAALKNVLTGPSRVERQPEPDLIEMPLPAVITVIYGPPPGGPR